MNGRNIKILIAVCAGFWLTGCQEDEMTELRPEEGQVPVVEATTGSEIIPGMVRLNFRRSPQVEKALMSLHESPRGKMGLMSVDAAIGDIPGASLERVIPYTSRFEKGDREWGFDMWYRLKFDKNMSVAEVQKILVALPEVEATYPVRRTVLPETKYEDIPLGPVGFATRAGLEMPFNDPMLRAQWNYGKGDVKAAEGSDIGVFKVWKQGIYGDPRVLVAIIDGGIQYDHPDLAANLWHNTGEIPDNGIDDDGNGYIDDVYGFNFFNQADHKGLLEPEGHGTHVAGTVGAVNNNGRGVCGIAGGSGKGDGIRMMSCQVSNGKYLYNEPEAFVYAARNGAVIAQCSWGGPVYEPDLEKVIEFFIDSAGTYTPNSMMKGGIVICAAGNDGRDIRTYPASLDAALAVASINAQRKRSSFSNFGDWVDLTAPGGELGSSEYQISSTWTAPDYYKTEKGTSMACPHVSGIAALVVSEMGGPGFTSAKLKEILLSSVADLSTTESYYYDKMGRGLLRADLALKCDDKVAPEEVADAVVVRGDGTECRLEWTHVADPNDGAAATYRIYVSEHPLSDGKIPTGQYTEIKAVSLTVGARMSYIMPVPENHSAALYYAVTAVDMWGNEAFVKSPVEWHWSVVFIGADELRVYPLPVVDELTVEWGEHFSGNREVRIYDLSGRQVYSQKTSGNEDEVGKILLDLKGLSAGSYMLEFRSDGKTERRSVLKV